MSNLPKAFKPQNLVTYEEAVDMLLYRDRCFGLYHQKNKQWRTAVYIDKWDLKKRLKIRFTDDANTKPSNVYDQFLNIIFPVNNIILNNNAKFNVTERILRDMSNLPKANIDEWVQNPKRKYEPWKKKCEPWNEKKYELLVSGFIKDQENKKLIATIPYDLNQIIAHYYYCLLCYIYSGKSISYLCDNGKVIRGDCLQQTPNKIFVYFDDNKYYGKKYDWILIPNERICPFTPLQKASPDFTVKKITDSIYKFDKTIINHH
eukprot:347337_1